TRSDFEAIVPRGLRSRCMFIDCRFHASNDVFMKGVFNVAKWIRRAPEPLAVGFILSKQRFRIALAIKPALPVIRLLQLYRNDALYRLTAAKLRLIVGGAPRPGIAEPHRRQ